MKPWGELHATSAATPRGSAGKGFQVVAGVFVLCQIGGTLPVPLYGLWGREFGFGSLTTTLLFAGYAVGTVVGLAVVAPLSDAAGRRPLLVAALLVAGLSTALFIAADGVPTLLAGRVMSGLSTGLATAVATVALSDLAKGSARPADTVATAANLGGLSLGPVLAGAFAQYAGRPTVLVFVAYAVVLVPAAAAMVAVPETVAQPRRPRASDLRRPRLPAGAEDRRPVLAAAAYMFCGFAVSGLFASLVPSFLRKDLHLLNLLLVGILVGLLFLVALAAQLLSTRGWWPRSALVVPACLVVGLAVLDLGLVLQALPVFVAGTVVAGVGFGLAVRQGVTAAQQYADDDHPADLVAAVFVAAYAGVTLSTLGLGVLDQAVGEGPATTAVAGVVAVVIVMAARAQHQRP